MDVTVDRDDDPLVEAGLLAGTAEGWRRGRDSAALTIRVERELAEAFKRVCAERGKSVSRVLRDVMRRTVGAKLLVEEARTMPGISKKSPLGRRLRALQKREVKQREARNEAEHARLNGSAGTSECGQ